MKARPNAILAVVVSLLVPTAIGAETVMLHIADAPESEYLTEARIEFAVALEDGVLDVFFDAGHIMFNTGFGEERPPEPPYAAQPLVIRIAKAGGARYLLEIGLIPVDSEDPLPAGGVFTFSDVVAEEVVGTGSVEMASLRREETADKRDLCVALGRAIAEEALAAWQP